MKIGGCQTASSTVPSGFYLGRYMLKNWLMLISASSIVFYRMWKAKRYLLALGII